jgi:hypothetical protein
MQIGYGFRNMQPLIQIPLIIKMLGRRPRWLLFPL